MFFIWDGKLGGVRQKNLEYRRGAKSHHWEKSWSDWTGRRSDPTRRETSGPALRTPSTGVEATPRRARGSSWKVSKIATFLTSMMEKGYTQHKVFAVVFESEREKKRREMLAIVTKTVDAHRLETMR